MPEAVARPKPNPWLFVPVLYLMQAMPVTIVQELTVIFYRDLGVDLANITRWTSLISLPWSLQLLLGPLVDLNGTKRNWILGGQLLITIGLIATALLLHLPRPFEISLILLAATAVTSALCNIATDGFYILTMSKDDQARFVGVQTTCYRLGRLCCVGLLVLFVGKLTALPTLSLTARRGSFTVATAAGPVARDRVPLSVVQGQLATPEGPLVPAVTLPERTYRIAVSEDGTIQTEGTGTAGTFRASEAPISVEPQVASAMPLPAAWSLVLLGTALVYGLGALSNRRTLPRPEEDRPNEMASAGETRLNIVRTLLLLAIGVGGYFWLNATLRLALHSISLTAPSLGTFSTAGWRLPATNKITLGTFEFSFGPVGTEMVQWEVCLAVVGFALRAARQKLRGTQMAEALTTFVRQPGFPAIFFFILTYRFGEAMVVKMSPLFLKDSLEHGGLAIDNAQLGIVKGVLGVAGIICGGLAGGAVVSKFGLRRAFLPLALLMHLPNLLYAYAAYQGSKLPLNTVPLGFLGPVPLTLAGIDFAEQFGYGFGFAGYMVYLMWVAQRGHFKTSHYAIGTGMGALCIATAGALSGVIQTNFGYAGFFLIATACGLPGLVALRLIPLEDGKTA